MRYTPDLLLRSAVLLILPLVLSCDTVGSPAHESVCSISPTGLEFGTVQVGSHADSSFTIANTGGGTLKGDVSESCSHYSIQSGGGGYSLGSGQSRTVTVRFAPTSTGTQTCTVETGTCLCAGVSCTGAGSESENAPPESEIVAPTEPSGTLTAADRTPIMFRWGATDPEEEEGEPGGVARIEIRLDGGDPLVFECPPDSGEWWYSSSTDSSSAHYIASENLPTGGNQAHVFRVRAQDTEGSWEAEADAPSYVFWYNYPPVTEILSPQQDEVVGPSFTINWCGVDIDGDIAEYQYILEPEMNAWHTTADTCLHMSSAPPGEHEFRVRARDEAGCWEPDYEIISFHVSSEQEPVCSVSPTSLEFGSVHINTQHLDKDFTITNTGGGTLTGDVSESCSHYSIQSGGGGYSLGSGQSRTVTVRFAPTSTGTQTCTVETGTSLCADVSCTGVGVSTPHCEVLPIVLEFGHVQLGNHVDLDFTITNTGGGTLTGDVSESCSHYSIQSGGGGYSLGSGQSRTVTVRFAPTSTGTQTCTVETGTSLCADVSCMGEGVEAAETAYLVTYCYTGTWCFYTNVPAWTALYRYWSWTGSHPIEDPAWNSCDGYVQRMYPGAIGWLSYFPSNVNIGDYGLDIDDSCTSITVEVTGNLQKETGIGGLWTSTDALDCPRYEFSIGEACESGSWMLAGDDVYTSGRIEVSVGYTNTAILGCWDAGVREVTYKFNGWQIPASRAVRHEGRLADLTIAPGGNSK